MAPRLLPKCGMLARTHADEVEALHQIARLLSVATDLTKAFTAAVGVLRSHLGFENGTVSLFDPVTGDVFIEAAPEMDDAERIQGRVRPGEGIVGRVFATGMPMAVPDLADHPLVPEGTAPPRRAAAERRALQAVPIRDGRATLGVVTAERGWGAGPFSFDRDAKVLATVAAMFGARIRLAQLESLAARARADDAPRVLPRAERFPGVVGTSPRWRAALEIVARVAPSRATVLLRGESGTGKEVVARALHDASPRAERPFVAVNCGALPEALVETELFGHERGAFTGAHEARRGCFEAADGGTLFLDEIGELPAAAQVKLLRAVQERQFERVGGRRTLTVDVRLVAATNCDLEAAVRAGEFRLDLYHRLQVVEIVLPPLRDRPEDVPALAARFLEDLAREHGRQLTLDAAAVEALAAAPWPGNVRQFRNVLERLVVTSARDRVTAVDVEQIVGRPGPSVPSVGPRSGPESRDAPPSPGPSPSAGAGREGEGSERARVSEALARAGYVQAKAARLLGMTARQLAWRVRKYGIELRRY